MFQTNTESKPKINAFIRIYLIFQLNLRSNYGQQTFIWLTTDRSRRAIAFIYFLRNPPRSPITVDLHPYQPWYKFVWENWRQYMFGSQLAAHILLIFHIYINLQALTMLLFIITTLYVMWVGWHSMYMCLWCLVRKLT